VVVLHFVRGGSQRRLDGDACFYANAKLWSSPYTGAGLRLRPSGL
jgi:hypothetical protein